MEEASKLKTPILLLSKDATVSRQVEHLLHDAGHEVTTLNASNETLRGLPTESIFGLVLIEQGGCTPEIIAELDQSRPGLPRIGLITSEDVHSTLLSQSLDELLYMPFRTEELSQVVLRWAGRRLQRTDTPSAPEDVPPIKISVLIEATDGDRELQQDMIEAFRDDLGISFAKIEEALRRGNLLAVSGESHALKGSAPYFGADRFTELADLLEKAGKRRDREGALVAFEACHAEYQRILRFFENLSE